MDDWSADMLVLAVAVSHSPAKQTMSRPVDNWLKKRGWPVNIHSVCSTKSLKSVDFLHVTLYCTHRFMVMLIVQ